MSKKNIFLLVALHYCIVIFAQTQNNNGFLNSVDTDPNTRYSKQKSNRT
jgi:hypothetical protein